MKTNPELELAWQFVENTHRNIYLTGKAGTGKTTFLHKIREQSNKRLVVVAPTGVAAINAKGVTIHSFFQLPFGPILPEQLFSLSPQKKIKQAAVQKFNKRKIDLIRSLDLLIIDEVSMVRADLLDGIDQVLRRFKNATEVFGGVQVLMIGDLQQLSPVVKENEWALLRNHYDTSFFFSSQAFLQSNAIHMELKHIFRQENQEFIEILNQIRNNKLEEKSLQKLNQQYQAGFEPKNEEGYITLTTHNHRAKDMNDIEIKKLQQKGRVYEAHIEGDFPEFSYPNDEKLELKIGAQVMFIKNDSSHEKRYFNGKIGRITAMSKEGVTVSCPGDSEEILAEKESWHHIKYTIDKQNEIKEDIIGSYSQIPLRLAWAITIHKSQGLTFEKAIIDAESSFAHGQTYVALSRCKTLEGIVLKSPINQQGIILDSRVLHFSQEVESQQPDSKGLESSKKQYQLQLLEQLFSFKQINYQINRCQKTHFQSGGSLIGHLDQPLKKMKVEGTDELMKISANFAHQLKNMSQEVQDIEGETDIQERITKAIKYYLNQIDHNLISPLAELSYTSDNKAIIKDFKKEIEELDDLIHQKRFCLKGCEKGFETQKYLKLRAQAIFEKKEKFKSKPSKEETSEHPDLFKALRAYRTTMAQDEGIQHYQVFTQKSLFAMCKSLPTTLSQLKEIHGIGKAKLNKYGDDIIDIIQSYCIDIGKEFTTEELPIALQKKSKNPTREISLKKFKNGATILDISKERGYTISTIEGHLASFISTGKIKLEELMKKEKADVLRMLVKSTKFDGLNDLKSQLGDQFSYDELKMVIEDLKYHNK